eukprot:scaffold38150_cov65-Phaeocystis_antarctica.AAC.18
MHATCACACACTCTARALHVHCTCTAHLLVDVRHPGVVALHSLLRLGLVWNAAERIGDFGRGCCPCRSLSSGSERHDRSSRVRGAAESQPCQPQEAQGWRAVARPRGCFCSTSCAAAGRCGRCGGTPE